MSLENLRKRVIYFMNLDLPDYQFRETLADDCVVFFTTINPKDWDKQHIMEFLKTRYDTIKSYVMSVCKQEELVDFLTDYHPTVESYIEKYKSLID